MVLHYKYVDSQNDTLFTLHEMNRFNKIVIENATALLDLSWASLWEKNSILFVIYESITEFRYRIR